MLRIAAGLQGLRVTPPLVPQVGEDRGSTGSTGSTGGNKNTPGKVGRQSWKLGLNFAALGWVADLQHGAFR